MSEENLKSKEKPTFKSDSLVILAADAAIAATEAAFKGVAEDDPWFRDKLKRAALEAALASIIT